MAEVAASIIGIVSAGTKVALVLSRFPVDVGSAGHEARMISGESRSFCSVLRTLGENIEHIEKSPRYSHCANYGRKTMQGLKLWANRAGAMSCVQEAKAFGLAGCN